MEPFAISPARHVRLFAALALLLTTVGCATATPVTPSPISVEDAPKLKTALVGTWAIKTTQNPGGPVKEASMLKVTFTADGVVAYNVAGAYHYRLEGRNIVSDGIFDVVRVEEWSDHTLKLFLFGNSETWSFTKI
jgi:hypothetical protein